MMTIFALLFFVSCAKNPLKLASQQLYKSHNCLAGLQTNINPYCKRLHVKQIGNHDILIRCYKDDNQRSNIWDSYIFRISSPNIKHSPESQISVEKHTICIDNGSRIEAYPNVGTIYIEKIE